MFMSEFPSLRVCIAPPNAAISVSTFDGKTDEKVKPSCRTQRFSGGQTKRLFHCGQVRKLACAGSWSGSRARSGAGMSEMIWGGGVGSGLGFRSRVVGGRVAGGLLGDDGGAGGRGG